MTIDELITRMRGWTSNAAIVEGDRSHTYEDLLRKIEGWRDRVASLVLPTGSVVSVEGEYGCETIAAFMAVAEAGHVVVPLSPDSAAQQDTFRTIASVEARCLVGDDTNAIRPAPMGESADHEIYGVLRARRRPGLVLFSSGSSGRPKAAVHDLGQLLERYATPRTGHRTLVFLLLDHIGGVNTLLYTLSSGGTVVVPGGRSPETVARAIETHRVELLPTSPTFLNLLLLSGAPFRYDLSSLRLITYGTEPMPSGTLERLTRAFPDARLQQTYGLTEIGILHSRSRSADSLWVRVGGEGFETKVVDGRLWVRARTAMLGYLNAPNPFDADGYLDTGDLVETDGEWVRFLGRRDDVINIGGSKVYPSRVEDVLLAMDGVLDAVVHGEAHAITGQIVVATVRIASPESPVDFKARMRMFCSGRLAVQEVPAKVRLTEEPIHSARFKRIRGGTRLMTAPGAGRDHAG